MSRDELMGQAIHAPNLNEWAEGLCEADLRLLLGELHTTERLSEIEQEVWAALVFQAVYRFLNA